MPSIDVQINEALKNKQKDELLQLCTINNVDTLLINQQLDDDMLKIIRGALVFPNLNIKTFKLSFISLTVEQARRITEILKDPNCKVTYFAVIKSNVDNSIAEVFAEFLKSPDCKINKLQLNLNNIAVTGATAIITATKQQNKLKSLLFWGNPLSDENKKECYDLIAKSFTSKLSTFAINDYGPELRSYAASHTKVQRSILYLLSARQLKIKNAKTNDLTAVGSLPTEIFRLVAEMVKNDTSEAIKLSL